MLHRIERHKRIGQGVVVSRPCFLHAIVAAHDAAGINYQIQDSLNDQDIYRVLEIPGLANTVSVLNFEKPIPFITGIFLETSDTDRIVLFLVSFEWDY